MNDIDNRIKRIEERLASITQGTWMSPPSTSVLGRGIVSTPKGQVIAMGISKDTDAEFITHAVRDVSFLLEKLAAANSALAAERQRVAVCEAALKFYADEENYALKTWDDDVVASEVQQDKGYMADNALAKRGA